jgi:hypothetical protein
LKIPITVIYFNRPTDLKNWFAQTEKLDNDSNSFQAFPFIVDYGSSDTSIDVIWKAIEDGKLHYEPFGSEDQHRKIYDRWANKNKPERFN